MRPKYRFALNYWDDMEAMYYWIDDMRRNDQIKYREFRLYLQDQAEVSTRMSVKSYRPEYIYDFFLSFMLR